MREPKNPDRLFEKALLANRVDGEQGPDFGLFYFATTKKAAKTTALILIFDQNLTNTQRAREIRTLCVLHPSLRLV